MKKKQYLKKQKYFWKAKNTNNNKNVFTKIDKIDNIFIKEEVMKEDEDLNRLEKEINKTKELNDKILGTRNDELEFFLGIVLLAAGLFMLSKRVVVTTGWGMNVWRIGGYGINSGTVVIPLIISIIWYIMAPKSKFAKIFIWISVIFIILAIIMSVSLYFTSTSLFDYILIIGMSSVGLGLILRTLFKAKK